MPAVEFEPTILVSERPKTHALDRTATGIGTGWSYARLMLGLLKVCTLQFQKWYSILGSSVFSSIL
jgi:hypothetical protein